jgi:hypothetical protein
MSEAVSKPLNWRFIFGVFTLCVGVVGVCFAFFILPSQPEIMIELFPYPKVIMGILGLVIVVIGAMVIYESIVLRGVLKGKYEPPLKLRTKAKQERIDKLFHKIDKMIQEAEEIAKRRKELERQK